jgi:hypothetical protein
MSGRLSPETPPAGPQCSHRDSTGWVCENHSYRPWDGATACGCGSAGMPCPSCNACNETTRRGFNQTRVSTTTLGRYRFAKLN